MTSGSDPLSQAIALHKAGNLAEAEQLYTQFLDAHPEHADALHLLGLAAHQQGRHQQAVESISRAIAIGPQAPIYHAHLAEALRALAHWQEAQASYERALQLNPDLIEARRGLAHALWAAGDVPAAEAALVEAIRRRPNYVAALVDYGRLLESQGHGAAALEMAERALQVQPDLAAAHVQRARALLLVSPNAAAAVAALREALRCDPNRLDVYVQLASLYNLRPDPDAALEVCQRGLQIDPSNAALAGAMGYALREQGRSDEAIDCFRRVVETSPNDPAAHSNLLYTMNLVDGFQAENVYAEHLEWARRHAEPLTAQAPPPANDRSPDRRLKVGYVSPFFRDSAVNFFIEPILQSHDHEQFEVYCYASFTPAFQPDATTARLQGFADNWRDVRAASDEQLAARVRADQIDILVDLSGHMSQSRLLAIARRAAPVQVTYLGYQNTTGMSAMDYRLTDERADPPGADDAFYTERLVRLPRCFFCYKPSEAPKVSPLPASAAGRVTFGSFNHTSKIGPRVLDAWMGLLSRVPGSRLIVLAYQGGYVERHLGELAQAKGLEPARIEVYGRCPRGDYLRLVQQADIALDPFPFSGHTTTCDALWMGVPVVMLRGDRYAGRVGSSVLAQVELDDLVAGSVEQYVEIAARLAGDLPGLAGLRRQLRQRMARSPILDFAGFTRHLEAAYRQMWHDWCAREPGR